MLRRQLCSLGSQLLLLGNTRIRTRVMTPLVQTRRTLPVCSVQTNLSGTQVPKDFHEGLSKVLATTLNKSEKVISVSVMSDVRMWRDGSDKPTAIVDIWSIGVFDAERNVKYTKDIFAYIMQRLNLPHDRIVLLLHPLQVEEAAHLTYAKLKQTGSTT